MCSIFLVTLFQFLSFGSLKTNIEFTAFWVHRVEAIDFSISVSILSPSEEEVAFNQAYWRPLPLSNNWMVPKKVAVVRAYFELLLKALDFEPIHEFVNRTFLQNRYKSISQTLQGISPLLSEFEQV